MDPIMMEKFKTVLKRRNGIKTWTMFHMAAFYSQEHLQNCLNSSIFPDPTELKEAIQLLQKLSLVESANESTFSISSENRSNLMKHKAKLEADVMKATLDLLKELRDMKHPDPKSLFEEICRLPGLVIFGFLRAAMFKDAYEFANGCIYFLRRNLGDYHRAITELKSFLTFVLLMMMKPKKAALTLLTDIHNKWIQVSGDESHGALLKMVSHANEEDRVDCIGAEDRARKIVFLGQKASDVTDCRDFEKWVLYCEVLVRLQVVEKAMGILDELIDVGKVLFGKDEIDVNNVMHVKAIARIEKLELDKAMELLKDIFEKRKEKFGPLNLKTICIQNDMGRILTHNKEFDDSILLLEELSRHLLQIVGGTHDLYLEAKENLILAYNRKYDLEKAHELSSSLIDTLVSSYGVFHPKTNDCKFNHGEILLDMERHDEARNVFQELLEIAEKSFAPGSDIALLKYRIFKTEHRECLSSPSILHSAVRIGDFEEVLLLIDEGEDIEAMDHTGRTPLHYASQFGHANMARVFIGRGASFNSQDHCGSTPLHIAKNKDMKKLLKSFADFFDAVKANDIDGVSSAALSNPIYLRARDIDRCTCLHWAALRGHTKLMTVLLELGSDPMKVTFKRNSPLHIAASKGHVSTAEALLQVVKPDQMIHLLDLKTLRLNTSLHVAAEKGFLEMVRTLLRHGAVFDAKNEEKKTPLLLSKDEGCKNLLGLVEGLFSDVKNGDIESVRAKLRGVEIEDVRSVAKARNADNRTLLQEARQRNHLELAKELLMFSLKDE